MKAQRFVVAGDNHGYEVDERLVEPFFEWMRDYNPEIVIHGGDVRNFAALRKKASPEERQTAIAPDYEAGTDFESRLFSFGKARFLLRGNHDERVFFLARDAKDAAVLEMATRLCREMEARWAKLRVKVLPYDSRLGVLEHEGIRVIHGYACGINSARRLGQIYGTCAFGHTHSMDIAPVERWPKPVIAYGTGCLCKIDQIYNQVTMGKLRHENGWLYGYTDGTTATYFQARFQGGRVYAAQAINCYGV